MANSERTHLDVSGLPRHMPGPSQLTWWGNLGFIVTESTTILVCAATWFYLRRNFQTWPPERTFSPDLVIPTITIIALIVATFFAWREGNAARVLDRPAVRLWGTLGVAMDGVVLVMRALEFNSLNTRWDSDAYGSVVWFIIGMHTTLLVLVFLEDLFYLLVVLLKPLTPSHATHVTEKADYAIFVAVAGVFIYILVYWLPRAL